MIMALKEITTGIQVIEVPVHWVNDGEKRLDAGFYAQDAVSAKILIDKIKGKGIKVDCINDLSNNIFCPGRLKRRYVSKKEGKPFLMPSEVFMFLPKATKYITNYPKNVLVKEKWLLITKSGTIGRCLITTKYIQKFILSNDLIRVILDERIIGYIYAYLNSWIGQAFLTKSKYGSTVKHIEPHHVSTIPIPRFQELEEEINQKILEAHKLRESAQEELLKAEEMIYTELGLPKIDEDDIEYFGGELGSVIKAFEVKASEIDNIFYRLDASYYVPVQKLIKKNLKLGETKGYFQLERLGDDIAEVSDRPTYKRIYVKPEDGYPILSGMHLRQIKLYDLKYISGLSFVKSGKSYLDEYKTKKGWILTTERGTTGVSALVTKYWDGWLASHNILRVIPKNINAGFLLAYLNTEYAQYQLKSKELGAVVKVLDPRDMENIFVPVPKDKAIEEKIGSLVVSAYAKKDKANRIEQEAIKQLEKTLEEFMDEHTVYKLS